MKNLHSNTVGTVAPISVFIIENTISSLAEQRARENAGRCGKIIVEDIACN